MTGSPETPRVRVVESGEALRAELVRSLASAGFETSAAAQAGDPSARDVLHGHTVHVVDLSASGALDWVRSAEARRRSVFLARTAGELRGVVAGAAAELDVLLKPFSIERLEGRIQARIGPLDRHWLARLDPLLETADPTLARVFERALRVARGEGPICLVGELGTGRRAIARAIHMASPRAAGPRIELDSSALHGTGGDDAETRVARAVASARGGVLVVVEPTDWSLRAQQSLARTLEACGPELEPRCISIVRARIDPSPWDGRLEPALAYRLAGVQLALPALRDRTSDQAAICAAIARRVALEIGQGAPCVDESLVTALARDGFPGNRLGVESRLRSALVEGRAERLAGVIAAEARSAGAREAHLPALELRTLERDAIVRALARSEGNRTHAARALGISVRTLRNKLHVYGLR